MICFHFQQVLALPAGVVFRKFLYFKHLHRGTLAVRPGETLCTIAVLQAILYHFAIFSKDLGDFSPQGLPLAS